MYESLTGKHRQFHTTFDAVSNLSGGGWRIIIGAFSLIASVGVGGYILYRGQLVNPLLTLLIVLIGSISAYVYVDGLAKFVRKDRVLTTMFGMNDGRALLERGDALEREYFSLNNLSSAITLIKMEAGDTVNQSYAQDHFRRRLEAYVAAANVLTIEQEVLKSQIRQVLGIKPPPT